MPTLGTPPPEQLLGRLQVGVRILQASDPPTGNSLYPETSSKEPPSNRPDGIRIIPPVDDLDQPFFKRG